MIQLSPLLCNFSGSKTFSLFFRNISKLKTCSRHARRLTISNISSKLIILTNQNIKINAYGTLLNADIRCMSRWVKYSQNDPSNNRKKRSTQLAQNVRDRIRRAKKETKKKMDQKISDLKENILTVPNGLCLLRIIATPFLGFLVLSEFYATSLGVFVFAGLTDLIDGYIARNFPNQQSMIGSFLDPAADKLLIVTLFITLTANGLIPVPLTSLIIVRDVCLFGAGFYIRYVSLPPPKTLSRYFDMSFVTAKLSPTGISKFNTFLQLSLVAASLAAPVFSYVDHTYLHILWYVTGTTTVLSAASYLYYKNSTYKLFNPPKDNDDR